jgi:hypothetical protein
MTIDIPDYLQDNPNYYIEWWDKFNITDNIKICTENILNLFDKLEIEECLIWPWYNWFKLKKERLDIWYISYMILWDELRMHYVKINDWNNQYWSFNNEINFQGQGYWKLLYMWVAIKAKEKWLTFVSDHSRDIKDNAKYIWNVLVNEGLAKFQEGRFRMINEKLP